MLELAWKMARRKSLGILRDDETAEKRRQFALTIEHDHCAQEQYELGDLEGMIYDHLKRPARTR